MYSHNKTPLRRLLLIALITLISGTPAWAYDSTQAIDLEADDLKLNNETGVLTYTGNVKLTQGEMVLTADTLKIHTVKRNVNRIEAFGELAKLKDRRPDGRLITAQAQRLDYNVKNETIELNGQGMIDHGGNTMRSESIYYDLTTSNLKAGSKQTKDRVHMTFQPENAPIGE